MAEPRPPAWLLAAVPIASEAGLQYLREAGARWRGRPSGLLPNEFLLVGARCPGCGVSLVVITDGDREAQEITDALRAVGGCPHPAA